jgi:hypothetical protein
MRWQEYGWWAGWTLLVLGVILTPTIGHGPISMMRLMGDELLVVPRSYSGAVDKVELWAGVPPGVEPGSARAALHSTRPDEVGVMVALSRSPDAGRLFRLPVPAVAQDQRYTVVLHYADGTVLNVPATAELVDGRGFNLESPATVPLLMSMTGLAVLAGMMLLRLLRWIARLRNPGGGAAAGSAAVQPRR